MITQSNHTCPVLKDTVTFQSPLCVTGIWNFPVVYCAQVPYQTNPCWYVVLDTDLSHSKPLENPPMPVGLPWVTEWQQNYRLTTLSCKFCLNEQARSWGLESSHGNSMAYLLCWFGMLCLLGNCWIFHLTVMIFTPNLPNIHHSHPRVLQSWIDCDCSSLPCQHVTNLCPIIGSSGAWLADGSVYDWSIHPLPPIDSKSINLQLHA